MPPRRGDGTPLSKAVEKEPDRSGFESPLEQEHSESQPRRSAERGDVLTLEEHAAGVSPGGLIVSDDPTKPGGYLSEARTEARHSLGLLLAGVCLGQVSPWLAWAAWFTDTMEYVPSSISEMVHRAGSEERDLFIGMALSGILLICSGFSTRLSNVRAKHSKVSAFVDAWRYIGVGLGACTVSFIPAREKDAQVSVRSSAHLLGAMLLFTSGLVTEAYVLCQDHPHLSHPDNLPERRSRQVLSALAALFVGVFLIFNLTPEHVGLRSWAVHSSELAAEVVAGGLLLMLHFAFWVFAPERKALHVPKTAFALWAITGIVMSIFFLFCGLHFHRVATFAPLLAAKRDNCMEVKEYRCVRCKPATMFGPQLSSGARECVRVSDDSMYWGELLLPRLADEFERCVKEGAATNYCGMTGELLEKTGKPPPLSDLFTFTNEKPKALEAKFLSYHVCVDGLKFRGIFVPDIVKLNLPELEYISQEKDDPIMQLQPHQRSVMTPACRFNDETDDPKDQLTGRQIQDMVQDHKLGKSTKFSSKGFTCIVSSLDAVHGEESTFAIDARSALDVVSDSLWRMNIALRQMPGRSSDTMSVTPAHEKPANGTAYPFSDPRKAAEENSLMTDGDAGFDKELPIPRVEELPRAMRTCRVKPYGLDERGLVINAGIGGILCGQNLIDDQRLTVDDLRCDDDPTSARPCEGADVPSASPVGQGVAATNLLERPQAAAREHAAGLPRVTVDARDNRVLVEIRPAGADEHGLSLSRSEHD